MSFPEAARGKAARPSLRTRVRTWRDRAALDQALASGIEPSGTPELWLRAEQVTDPGSLRRAAASLEGVVDSAEAYGPSPKPPVPLRTQAAIHARAALLGLAQRLRDDDVVGARAAAMTNELLGSCDSPLYSDSTAGSVWDLARGASREIDEARQGPLPART